MTGIEKCYTKAVDALLVINLRKNPRAEQPVVEDYFGMKKQRTTGEFGQASCKTLDLVLTCIIDITRVGNNMSC